MINHVSGYAGDTVDVNVINISKDGMAFKSDYKFKPEYLLRYSSYYLPIKNDWQAVIEIIRME